MSPRRRKAEKWKTPWWLIIIVFIALVALLFAVLPSDESTYTPSIPPSSSTAAP